MKKNHFMKKQFVMVNILNIDSQGPKDSENAKKSSKQKKRGTLTIPVIKNVNKSLAPPRGHEIFFFKFSKIMILA